MPFYRFTGHGLEPYDPRLTVAAQRGRAPDPRLTERWRKMAKRAIRRQPWCSNPDCEHEISRANPLQGDHIVSLAAGGAPFDEANVQVLCRKCNRAKGSL